MERLCSLLVLKGLQVHRLDSRSSFRSSGKVDVLDVHCMTSSTWSPKYFSLFLEAFGQEELGSDSWTHLLGTFRTKFNFFYGSVPPPIAGWASRARSLSYEIFKKKLRIVPPSHGWSGGWASRACYMFVVIHPHILTLNWMCSWCLTTLGMHKCISQNTLYPSTADYPCDPYSYSGPLHCRLSMWPVLLLLTPPLPIIHVTRTPTLWTPPLPIIHATRIPLPIIMWPVFHCWLSMWPVLLL
jgi:hypothetical protein